MTPCAATKWRIGLLCMYLITTVMVAFVDGVHVSVDPMSPKRRLSHFWSSTGFSPPASGQVARDFLSSDSVTRNLDMIGALPNHAIHQIRVHWLLDLIKPVRSEGNLTWSYELLDSFLDKIMRSGLRPRFELMGNPGGMFTDFSDAAQAEIWKGFIRSMVRRYALRYGAEEVSNWAIETWNEPDLRQYNILNMTFAAYISYFRETVHGLRGAEALVPGLRIYLVGPAGLFKQKVAHPLCWGLLEYCNRLAGQNVSCGLSEISYHHKGHSSVNKILSGGLSLVKQLNREMPYLKHLPISNDEADPLSGWWRPLPWREDVRMAAMITKSVAVHMKWFLRSKPRALSLLGGDHGFLAQPPNFFNQRTLLARYPMDGNNEQVFRKPSLGAMLLLGMLGNKVVTVNVTDSDERLSCIVTSDASEARTDDWTVEVLLTVSDDERQNSSERIPVSVTISGLENRFSGSIYRVLQLSSALPHPASIWDQAGRPDRPDATLRAQMRAAEGPHVLEHHPVGRDELNITLRVALPSVTFVQICGPSTTFPGRVTKLRAVNVTFNEVLLIYRDKHVKSKCILMFQVEFCKGGLKSKCIVLKERNMYLAYHYAPRLSQSEVEEVRGRYRVRAIDVWGRPGPHSKAINYGQ